MAISLKESLVIGFTDFWSRKIRSFVTILGIILGTMSIIVVLAIVNGVNKSTLAWMSERGGLTKIDVQRNWNYDEQNVGKRFLTLRELNFIHTKIPEVTAFNPQLQDYKKFKHVDKSYNAQLIGVLPDFTIAEEWDADQGRFISKYDEDYSNDVIVLGTALKDKLFGAREAIGQYVTMGNLQLRVIGIMKERIFKQPGGGFGGGNMLEYLNYQAFIPLSTMIHKVTGTDEIESFSVKAPNPQSATEIRQKLEALLLNLRAGKPIFTVEAAQEEMEQMKKNSMIFQVIFFLVASISLMVGGIVIMNIMLATIQERTREIGIRLAVGARRRDIFMQFMIQTVLMTSIGGVLGIMIGFSILKYVGKYLNTVVAASSMMVVIALIVSAGVGLVFGIFPAIRASNLDPVEALRNE
ncbi:MAG TPA: ABC transporter permease [Candidatus Cloacimonadota bacterium]|nr:ABC transporter permease [Candidatus Cloacimonadota bacterium]HPT71352.1 ABC transporter permease [Candidatus Cloacimonadota bacterium]